MDKSDLVREWMHKAERDIGMAELALVNKPEYTDAICFHCQQAAEKYLKAYLVFLNIRFEKRHNLSYLLDLIDDQQPIPEAFYDLTDKLEDYAVETRYPDDWFEIPLEEAKEAFQVAMRIKEYVLEKMHLTSAPQEGGR
jgi:HEPN domain-containing protein